MSWVEFRQEANGIPIFQGQVRAAFTAREAGADHGQSCAGLDYERLNDQRGLSPAEAAAHAAANRSALA